MSFAHAASAPDEKSAQGSLWMTGNLRPEHYMILMQLLSVFCVLNNKDYECSHSGYSVERTKGKQETSSSFRLRDFIQQNRCPPERAALSVMQLDCLQPPEQPLRSVRGRSSDRFPVHGSGNGKGGLAAQNRTPAP